MLTHTELTDDPRLLQAAHEYLAELEAGRVPSRISYLTRFPEMREALTECFDGIEIAHAAGLALQPLSVAPQPELGASPLGDFQILSEIGRGGMGIVYEAMQLSLGRRVALKVLPFAAALDSKQLHRFKTEAHAAAQLHHTNIVPVYAVGCERGMHFYAMQLIEGRSLDQVIGELRGDDPVTGGNVSTIDLKAASSKAIPPSQRSSGLRSGRSRESYRTAARIMAQVAEALEYAHEAGVVHRDVKPANLIIDAKGNVWVTDFGLAQVTADVGLTQSGDIFGTLRYMSPEQASGRRAQIDHRTDVYSLGATLYELLTLEPLFPSEDRQTLLHQILNEEPRLLRRVDRSIPIEVETIVLKAVAKSPEERYATAGELAADLRRFLDERPILARRPSLVDRSRKWMRRHPSVLAGSVLLLVFIIACLAASTAMIAREQGRTKAALDRIALEQLRTQEALDGERQRALEAEQRFQLARRAADEMIRMAQEELIDQPHLQSLRMRLLETSLAYYQEFIELRRDSHDSQVELADTRDRVKGILDDLAVMQGALQFYLLNETIVLNDLDLTDDQRTRLIDLTKQLDRQRHDSFRGFHRLSAEERNQRFLDLARTNDAAVSEILSPQQRLRLGQIALQWQGIAAFRDGYVIKELKLTTDQRDRIRSVESDLFPSRPDGHRYGPPGAVGKKDLDRKEQDWVDQDRKARTALDKVVATLKPEQLKKWKELTGTPVKGEIPFRPKGRFGPPGPGGPGPIIPGNIGVLGPGGPR